MAPQAQLLDASSLSNDNIARRPRYMAKLLEGCAKARARKNESHKASMRTKTENPFAAIRCQFGCVKLTFKRWPRTRHMRSRVCAVEPVEGQQRADRMIEQCVRKPSEALHEEQVSSIRAICNAIYFRARN